MNIHTKVFIVWVIIVISVNLIKVPFVDDSYTPAQIFGPMIVVLPVYIAVPYIIYFYTIRKIIDKRRKPKDGIKD